MCRRMAEFIPCGLGANASFVESVSFIQKLRDGWGAQDTSSLSLILSVQHVNRQGRTCICSVNRWVLSTKVWSTRLWTSPTRYYGWLIRRIFLANGGYVSCWQCLNDHG